MTFKTWLENSEGVLRQFPPPSDPTYGPVDSSMWVPPKSSEPPMGRRTDSQSEDFPPDFIDPDTLYDSEYPDKTAFVYTGEGHLLVGNQWELTHDQMGRRYPELRAIMDRQADHERYGVRDNLSMECLLGRISDFSLGGGWNRAPRNIVSFWNSPADLVPLLKPCLQELLLRHLVTRSTELHHPKIQPTTVGEYLEVGGRAQTDPDVERRAELARQLHILPADQKRVAMKKLGLGTMGKANAWTAAMRQAGIPAGSSHHFPTSEARGSVSRELRVNR